MKKQKGQQKGYKKATKKPIHEWIKWIKEGRKNVMMQNEERINEMHQRAGRIKRKNEMIRTSVYGVTSFILMVVLVAVVIIQGSTVKNMDTGQYVGTSIFDASVGGYVLVAIISFAVATVITVLCIRWKEKHETTKRQEKGESK